MANRIYYQSNTEHPLYLDLVSIIEKTVGIIALLKEELNDSRIKCSFLFGSVAKNQEKGASDLDLIVVGSLAMRALSKVLSGSEEKLNREINPYIFSNEVFIKRIKKKDHFILIVLRIIHGFIRNFITFKSLLNTICFFFLLIFTTRSLAEVLV